MNFSLISPFLADSLRSMEVHEMQPLPVRSITVTLNDGERAALAEMSAQDARYPKQQINWLIREEARRRGLLDPPGAKNEGSAVVVNAANASL